MITHDPKFNARGRPGGHLVVDSTGRAVAQVTSFAYVHEDMTFIALACADESFRPKPGEELIGVRATADKYDGHYDERSSVQMVALERFPTDAERDFWPTRYSSD